MRRRAFITLLGGAAAGWPRVTRAQQAERLRRIGVLMNLAADDPESSLRVAAFTQGLHDLGWSVGRNAHIDYRWSGGQAEGARIAAAELLSSAPDVIVANGAQGVAQLRRAARTVPVVFMEISEPVFYGFVESLVHPGGNMTGFTGLEPAVGARWLELLKEIAPHVARVTVTFNPRTAPGAV